MNSPTSSREKILVCARELFYHVGYQTTSVDDILKKCGVAKSNFYYHFESKEQLALEVLELRVAEYEDLIVRSLQNAEMTPSARLQEFFEHLCRAQKEWQHLSGCPFGNFAATLPTQNADAGHERFRVRLSQFFQHMEAAMRDCLAEGIQRGEFRADVAPSEMAAFLFAAIEGLMILTKTYKDVAPLTSGLAVAQKLLLPGKPSETQTR